MKYLGKPHLSTFAISVFLTILFFPFALVLVALEIVTFGVFKGTKLGNDFLDKFPEYFS